MSVPIIINSLNDTNTYFIDIATKTQVAPNLADGIALLRYIPIVIGIHEGEVYANAEELIKYSKFTVECTIFNVSHVNVFAKKISASIYIQVGYKLVNSISFDFSLLGTDFAIGDDLDIKVEDFINTAVYDESTAHVYSTITMITPILYATVAGNITGTANCATVKVQSRVSGSSGPWIDFAIGVNVINGIYVANGTMVDTGIFDFRTVDENDLVSIKQLSNIVVSPKIQILGYINGEYLVNIEGSKTIID